MNKTELPLREKIAARFFPHLPADVAYEQADAVLMDLEGYTQRAPEVANCADKSCGCPYWHSPFCNRCGHVQATIQSKGEAIPLEGFVDWVHRFVQADGGYTIGMLRDAVASWNNEVERTKPTIQAFRDSDSGSLPGHETGDAAATASPQEQADRDQAGWYVLEDRGANRWSYIYGDYTRQKAFEVAKELKGRVVRLESNAI